MTVSYRSATPADGPALDAMARAIWVETFGHSASATDIDLYLDEAYGTRGKLLRDLADPAVTFHLACEGEAIVGYAKLTAPFVDPAHAVDAVQLSQLYVASTHHGAGIADRLMDWVLATARARGHRALVLTVWEENGRARRYYEKRGFAHVGDYAFRTGTQVDRDLVMRLPL